MGPPVLNGQDLVLGGLTFKNRGHWGSRYILIIYLIYTSAAKRKEIVDPVVKRKHFREFSPFGGFLREFSSQWGILVPVPNLNLFSSHHQFFSIMVKN